MIFFLNNINGTLLLCCLATVDLAADFLYVLCMYASFYNSVNIYIKKGMLN